MQRKPWSMRVLWSEGTWTLGSWGSSLVFVLESAYPALWWSRRAGRRHCRQGRWAALATAQRAHSLLTRHLQDTQHNWRMSDRLTLRAHRTIAEDEISGLTDLRCVVSGSEDEFGCAIVARANVRHIRFAANQLLCAETKTNKTMLRTHTNELSALCNIDKNRSLHWDIDSLTKNRSLAIHCLLLNRATEHLHISCIGLVGG